MKRTPFRVREDGLHLALYLTANKYLQPPTTFEIEAGSHGTTLVLTPAQAQWLIQALTEGLEDAAKQATSER